MPLAFALVHEENGSFGISFPDFPGCISGGESEDEAIRRGSDALTFHVAGILEDGEPLPVLRSLAELRQDSEVRDDMRDAVVALVPFERPGKSVRINISIDENLLDSVDRAASSHKQSRSAFLADAVRAKLRDAV